jgi:hypothetical protein
MGYQRMTQAEWADLIAKQGYENAVQIARDFGTVIDEAGVPPSAVNPALAARPMVTGAPARANVPPEQGTTPMDTPAGGLNAATAANQTPSTRDRLRAADEELMGLYEGLPALRKQQFESGQQRINEMYAGPSTSSQLFALSRALLAPRKFKGFAGTMQNVSNALGQIGEQREMAQMKRAEALARLQESYQTGEFEGKMDILKARRDALRAELEAEQPAKRRTGFNPITGALVDMETNEPITSPPPKVGEVRQGYRYMGGDPASQSSWQKVR